MALRILFAILLSSLVTPIALANPVSFKGGYGVMPAYNRDWHDIQLNYSLSNRQALGISSFYREGRESTASYGIGQYNQLLKRWNELDSQATVNLSIGLGGRHDSRRSDALAGYVALEVDYETRTVYTQLAAETLQSESGVHFSRYRARAGVAPYKAAFEGLQSWLIVQVDYMPEMEDCVRVTPMGRFFYNNVAFEAGISLQGIPFVGGAAHF
jgi:hypothetical protein